MGLTNTIFEIAVSYNVIMVMCKFQFDQVTRSST